MVDGELTIEPNRTTGAFGWSAENIFGCVFVNYVVSAEELSMELQGPRVWQFA